MKPVVIAGILLHISYVKIFWFFLIWFFIFFWSFIFFFDLFFWLYSSRNKMPPWFQLLWFMSTSARLECRRSYFYSFYLFFVFFFLHFLFNWPLIWLFFTFYVIKITLLTSFIFYLFLFLYFPFILFSFLKWLENKKLGNCESPWKIQVFFFNY